MGMKKLSIIIIIINHLGFCNVFALPNEKIIPNKLNGIIELKSLNKLNFNQQISFGTALSNNDSYSYGVFSNNFDYSFNKNINLKGGIHLLKNTNLNQNNYPNHNFDVLYNFEIKYKLSENTHMQISVNNISPHINTFKSLLK
tara:strand:- start:449 stop:877 length:429 start_codon:yes stop_codon:yes gene_type:complete